MKENLVRTAFGALLLVLSGCTATAEQRARTALIEAGAPDPIAECMAARMASKLSIPQLLKLRSLSGARSDDGTFSAREFVRRLAAIDDPEVVSVTSRAAIGCAIAG